MSLGSDLIALARSKAGQWYYTNDQWARMNPEQSGGTDCSGFVRWCYLQFGYDVGTWTGDESYAGYEIARGHYPWEIPWDDMQPGDLILMTATYWNNYEFNEYLCHIELYCGEGTMIGHPGGYGPQEKWAQAWMESYGCITWMVRRVFESEDDMTPDEVWQYYWINEKGSNTAPGGNMYNCLVDVHRLLGSHKSAAGDGTVGDMSQRLDYVDMRVRKMAGDVDGIKKAVEKMQVGGGSVDYDKLADAVADKLAARMKD